MNRPLDREAVTSLRTYKLNAAERLSLKISKAFERKDYDLTTLEAYAELMQEHLSSVRLIDAILS